MTSLADMGLPQGLPELTGSYGIIRWPYPVDHEPREMTAADLGLRERLTFTYVPTPEFEALMAQMPLRPTYARASDAPYSFWLGADHG